MNRRRKKHTVKETKSLCMIPWLHRFTNEQGLHLLCCSGIGESNVLRGEHGQPLNVRQQLTDAELLNSPDLKAIRVAMLRDEWPDACERCRRSEETGAVSIRRHINGRFGHRTAEALAGTAEDGTLDRPQVRYADIRLGNVCNLTCRMCGPSASRLWAEHFNEVQPKSYQVPVQELTYLRDHNWVKSQSVAFLMEQCLPTVESLHFAGGEPLIIPEMLEALDLCIQSGRADQIDLSYNTNLTVIPDRVARLWPYFRTVSIHCSIDGFGILNDYIRRPSQWSDVDRNLHLLDQNFKEWKLRLVVCCTTVQTYNVLQLGELFDYLAGSFQNVTPAPGLTPLYEPAYLSIRVLPPRVKEIARQRLLAERSKAMASKRQVHENVLSTIDTTLAYLDESLPRKHFMDFLYFSEKSDRQFGDSWRRACPELARLLRGEEPAPVWDHGPRP
jgi:sulfatase maturation enzyme AslB (radical SAM superfamily)